MFNLYANVAQIYNRANNFFWNRDYISAIRDYRTIVNNYPTTHYADQALYSLGSCYFELKDYSNAIIAYSKLIDDYRRSNLIDDALYRLAECYVAIGDFEKANNSLVRIIQDFPDSLLVRQARLKLNSLPYSRQPSTAEQEQLEQRRLAELRRRDTPPTSPVQPHTDISTPVAVQQPVSETPMALVSQTAELEAKLNQQQKEFEEILKIEEKKLRDARESTARFRNLLESANREIDNYRNQLQEMNFFRDENEKLKQTLLERENTIAEFRRKLLAEAAQYKAEEAKLNQKINDLRADLAKAEDMSQEEGMRRTIERNNREIASLNFQIEKKENDLSKLEDENRKLRQQLTNAIKADETTNLKKELISVRRENVQIRSDIDQLQETLQNRQRQIAELNREITKLEADTTPVVLRARISQKEARIRLLENTIEDYKMQVSRAEDIQVLNQRQMQQTFNKIESEIEELKIRLQQTEKELEQQRNLSEREKSDLRAEISAREKELEEQLSMIRSERTHTTPVVSLVPDDEEQVIELKDLDYTQDIDEVQETEEVEQDLIVSVTESRDRLQRASRVQMHLNNGINQFNDGNYGTAKLELLKALEIDKNNSDVYNYLGLIHLAENENLSEAIQYFDKASDINPNNKVVYQNNKAKALLKQNNYEEAITILRDIVKIIPEDNKKSLAEVHFTIGEAYLSIGDNDRAFFEFFEVLKLVPTTDLALEARNILERI